VPHNHSLFTRGAAAAFVRGGDLHRLMPDGQVTTVAFA
jgi:hypothetical protein